MKNSRAVVSFCACMMFTLTLVGCWFGNLTAPATSVSPTSHPLVAQYNLQNMHAGLTAWVEFGTDTTYGRQTSKVTSSVTSRWGETLSILVAGMQPQTTYHMRAHVDSASNSWVDEDRTFTTGALAPLPYMTASSFKMASLNVSKPSPGLAPAPGVELLSLSSPANITSFNCLATDLQGNVIWYYPITSFPIKLLTNGHFMLNIGTDLREIDLIGNTIRDVSVAQVNQSLQAKGYSFVVTAFSHDFLVLPNGHWITIGLINKSFDNLPGYAGVTNVIGDSLVDIDTNGNVVWGWNGFDSGLDINRHLQGLPDWTHSNALVYTQDGNLLLSMRHQSWILKIDYENGAGTGNILWKLGEDGDFTLLGGDPTEWFYAQHDPELQGTNGSQMTLAVYDDGNLRIDSSGVACGTSATAPACYSRGTIFQVDEDTKIASLLWQDLPGFYSFWGGSIGVLSNDNVEFDSTDPFNAPLSQIMEVTHSDSAQTVWQMSIGGQFAYRGTRIPSLYPGVTWQK